MNPTHRFRQTVVLLLSIALCSLIQAEDPPAGLNLVVTGHSFHLPVMGTLGPVVASAKIQGHRLAVRQMIGGSSVTQHWDLPDDKNTAKTALRAGGNKRDDDVAELGHSRPRH